MNIQTVRDNLKNTIAGKEKYLAEVRAARCIADCREDIALHSVQELLKINIDELRAILADVEKCMEKASYDSWKENPDRMGGQFTEEEINRGSEWR
jgi:hypothetical protein